MGQFMTNKDDKKKRKKKRDRRNEEPFDDDFEDEEDDDPMSDYQKMMDQMGSQIMKMVMEMMKQMYPDMKDMTEEEFQNVIKENMANFRIFPFNPNMMGGKGKFPGFAPPNSRRPTKAPSKEEREPLVDIMDEENEIVVVAEIPGCVKENIELKATKQTLTIIAHDERNARKYNTTVELPSPINENHARARYRNGILEVKLEKLKGNSKGKKISVE